MVALPRQFAVLDFEIVVTVPGLAFAVPELHEANPAFDKAAGNEDLPRLNAFSVHITNVFRLTTDIKGLCRFSLHAEAEFERLDASFQSGIILPGLGMTGVEATE